MLAARDADTDLVNAARAMAIMGNALDAFTAACCNDDRTAMVDHRVTAEAALEAYFDHLVASHAKMHDVGG